MLNGMGANITTNKDGWIEIHPLKEKLKPLNITVPTDPSSAFFFAVATCIIPNSKIILRNVSLNETRIEGFRVLEKMGANISYENVSSTKELVGDILVSSSELTAISVKDNIAWLIDEIPALAIAFIFAKGVSTIKNAKELRVKECDRIMAVANNLKELGIKVQEFEDGFEVTGGDFNSGNVLSYGDHRIAMSFAILGLVKDISIDETNCINTSFPNFFELIERLRLNK
jgi:3-phosphoshikimate 1-carboxyvinyltransferase